MKSLEQPDKHLLSKRGEGTRHALIMAGLDLFGEHGVSATSTRMLAERSGANIAAIQYYFAGKEGLYRAVVEYIVERIDDQLGQLVSDVQESLTGGQLSRELAREALHLVLGGVAKVFVESDEPKAWARIIVREQAHPTEAFEVFHEGVAKRMQGLIMQLVGLCVGLDPDSDEVKIRAHALVGQILSYLVSRESLLRALGTRTFTGAHVALIHQVLAAHVDACLDAPPVTGKRT